MADLPASQFSFDPSEIEAALPPLLEALERATQALQALEKQRDVRLIRLISRVLKLRMDLLNYRLKIQREVKRAAR